VEAPAAGEKAIRAMHSDAQKRIWLGTGGGRLVCLENGRFFAWDLNLGAPEYALLGILSDAEGDLWVSTSSGIYHIAQRDIVAALAGQGSLRPRTLFKSESAFGALPTYGWPRAVKSPDEKLWFALASGVVVFDLRAPVNGLFEPPVLVEEIVVNGQAVPLPDSKPSKVPGNVAGDLRFPSDLRSLAIQFTALNFSMPEKVRFRHRLEGYEADWVGSDQSRIVQYGKLPYGAYRYRVQGGYEGGSWFDNEASFSFLIPIPLWRTSWAMALYALVAVVLVASAARMVSNRRLRHRLAALAAQQAMERERMRIAQDMHDEIGSKLTKISFMSERAIRELKGHEPVANKLDSIARTSRDLLQSLDEIVWAVNPHNDTLEHLAVYLGQYATEYLQNTAVHCELSIARGLPDYPLSAETRHNLFLAFEESLNNALKHGRASSIRIEMFVDGSRFRIRIHDNGSGFDSRGMGEKAVANGANSGHREGNGLPNMRQRLALLGGEFQIESQPGKGTVVSFSVPLVAKVIQARKK
jgi:signal transduction histidine kinase